MYRLFMGVKLTRERKLYAAVMGLGLGAVALDRVLFTPSGAEGAVETGAAGTEADAVNVEAGAAAPNRTSMAEQLRALGAGTGEARDAFRPDDSWAPAEVKVAAASEPVPEAASAEAGFRKEHKLSAVMKGPNGAIARVGRNLYQVGANVDGFTLVEVGQRSATFESGGVRVELTLDK